MPTTIPVAAFIVGAVLVLIAIIGGNLEMFGIKMSGPIRKGTRLVAGLVGSGFIGLALWLSIFPLPPQLPPTSVVPSGASARYTNRCYTDCRITNRCYTDCRVTKGHNSD